MGKLEFSRMEFYAVAATDGLVAFRGLKQLEVNQGAGLPGGLLNLLLRGPRKWNLENIEALCYFFGIEPDEFFRVGRIIHARLSEQSPNEYLVGTKPGSFERFRRLYDRASLGTWVPQVHPAAKAAAWSPAAYASYEKGKLDDGQMYAALRDMVSRLVERPAMTAQEIEACFGLLRE